MNDKKVHDLLEEAGQEYNAGKYAEAIEHWKQVLEEDPENQKAREGIRMAQLLVVNWEAPDAGEAAEEGTASGAVDADLQQKIDFGVTRVKDLLGSGRLQEAMEGCQLLTELAPGLPAVRQLKEEVSHALELRPVIDEHIAQAKRFLSQGKQKEAAEAARKVLSLDGGNKEAKAILASGGSGSPAPKAPSAFQVGGQERPAPPSPFAESDDLAKRFNLEESGPREALSPSAGAAPAQSAGDLPLEMDFDEALAAPAPGAQGEIEGLLHQGEALFAQGKYDEAIEVWSHVFALDQGNVKAGELIDKARARLEESGRQADEIYYRAVDLFEKGSLDAAKSAFEQVLTLQPENVDARSYLDQIESKRSGVEPGDVAPVPLASPQPSDGESSQAGPDPDLVAAARAAPPPPEVIHLPKPPLPVSAGPVKRVRIAAPPPPPPRHGTRVVVAMVALVAALSAGWFFLSGRSSDEPPQPATPQAEAAKPTPAPPAQAAATEDTPPSSPAKATLDVVPSKKVAARHAAAPRPPSALTPEQVKQKVGSLMEQANALYDAKQYAAAQARFQEVLALDPVNFKADEMRMKAAQSLAEETKFNHDLDAAKQAFADGDWGGSLYKLYRLREKRASMTVLKRYIENANWNWGIESMGDFNIDAAIEHLNDANEMAPADAAINQALEVARRYEHHRRDAAFDAFVASLKRKTLDQP